MPFVGSVEDLLYIGTVEALAICSYGTGLCYLLLTVQGLRYLLVQ